MIEKLDRKILISTLWTFILMNMIYADITGQLAPGYFEMMTKMSQILNWQMVLTFSILLEIPIGLIILSRLLEPKYNRIINFIAIPITILYVLYGGLEDAPISYLFFATVEIISLLVILQIVWKWKA